MIEILVSLTLGLVILSLVCEVFLANQRSLREQLALSKLETRLYRVTGLFRSAIQRAEGKINVINEDQLQAGANIFYIEKNNLMMLDVNHRKNRLMEEVSNLHIIKYPHAVDVSMRVASGSVGETIHVFTALK